MHTFREFIFKLTSEIINAVRCAVNWHETASIKLKVLLCIFDALFVLFMQLSYERKHPLLLRLTTTNKLVFQSCFEDTSEQAVPISAR